MDQKRSTWAEKPKLPSKLPRENIYSGGVPLRNRLISNREAVTRAIQNVNALRAHAVPLSARTRLAPPTPRTRLAAAAATCRPPHRAARPPSRFCTHAGTPSRRPLHARASRRPLHARASRRPLHARPSRRPLHACASRRPLHARASPLLPPCRHCTHTRLARPSARVHAPRAALCTHAPRAALSTHAPRRRCRHRRHRSASFAIAATATTLPPSPPPPPSPPVVATAKQTRQRHARAGSKDRALTCREDAPDDVVDARTRRVAIATLLQPPQSPPPRRYRGRHCCHRAL